MQEGIQLQEGYSRRGHAAARELQTVAGEISPPVRFGSCKCCSYKVGDTAAGQNQRAAPGQY
jgi:hypothetical protein